MIWFPPDSTVVGILFAITSMLLVVCIAQRGLRQLLKKEDAPQFRSMFHVPHFSIRDLLWLLVLLALLFQPLSYSP